MDNNERRKAAEKKYEEKYGKLSKAGMNELQKMLNETMPKPKKKVVRQDKKK